jgi:hypothetical protein
MTVNIDALSDDELLNLEAPPSFVSEEDPDAGQDDQQNQGEQQENETPADDNTDPDPDADKSGEGDEGGSDAGGGEADDKEAPKPEEPAASDADLEKQDAPAAKPEEKPAEQEQKPAEQQKSADEKKEPPKAEAEKPAEGAQTVDYEAEYKKLIGTPIKANGKEITLKSADEVMRLVQQGAGYSAKMEALKPARRAAAMLEAAGLLGDENALGHMIDAYNGNPQAIAKLVKDLKIDLLDLDLDSGDKYSPSGHIQTDEAVNFQDALKELRTSADGKEALALIEGMDDASKRLIWGNAQAVRQIAEYKANGVYDTVASELDRRRTLGEVPADKPYIVAFQEVGADLARQAEEAARAASPAVQDKAPPAPSPAKPEQRKPVHSGPAPRKQEQPDARAAAAASPRSGVGVAKTPLDIFNLSDADIEKMSAPPQ